MFEAHFQTFDDSSERAESAARVERLRGEQKFSSVDALVAQIRSDIEKSKEMLQ